MTLNVLVFIIVSCTHESSVLSNIKTESDVSTEPAKENNNTDYRLSIPEVKDVISDFFDNEEIAVKSLSERIIKNVEVVCSTPKELSTRSYSEDITSKDGTNNEAIKDTLSYIVNFENDNGFAIVSADKRTEPVLFFSEDGNFSLSETLAEDNKAPFLYQMELIANYVQSCKSDFENNPITKSRNFQPVIGSEMKLMYEETPRVKVFWGQSAPYNAFCPIKKNQRTLVGCVAVAMGMVMSVTQNVRSFRGVALNWNLINRLTNATAMYNDNTGAAAQVQNLLYKLGVSVNMDYGIEVVEPNPDRKKKDI